MEDILKNFLLFIQAYMLIGACAFVVIFTIAAVIFIRVWREIWNSDKTF